MSDADFDESFEDISEDDFDDMGNDDYESEQEESAYESDESDEDTEIIMDIGDSYANRKKRAEIARIPDAERTTRDVMDHYEFAKCHALRTQQIANGQQPFLTDTEIAGLEESSDIAKKELMLKRTPYIIVRKVPHSSYKYAEEHWKLSELTF